MNIDWQYIQNNFDWLGHIAEALCIAAVVTALGLVFFKRRTALIIGLAFASGYFHGREKRDFEVSVHMHPPHLEAYEMWKWSWDQATDFWPVAILMFALLLLAVRYKSASTSDLNGHPQPPQERLVGHRNAL
ncbi:hypothetical protein [Rhizobium sp. PL01]|uniref:hypothetical protein n=1 Tax=Rhizobium sp. PL01 TaxID=3085631 RepID=UPI002981DB90|nr:hypothetical protein [Rhizobium sp. PL01]MDW5313002.1 hypothetical protein [Rhizobium sp. PL01]